MSPRAAVLIEARRWLGTPYRHQASLRAEGADCLGLVRGVWRVMYGTEPEASGPYAPDWAERGGDEALSAGLGRWMIPVAREAMGPGDVMLFRMHPQAPAKHCAVLSALGRPEPRMIHAYWARAVVESWMGSWWERRLVAAFTWPAMKQGDEAWRR